MEDIKAKVEEKDTCRKELEITVPSEKMEAELARTYREIGKGRKIKGFRPGRAPRAVLEKYFSAEAHDLVIKNQVKRAYFEIIRREKLEVVGEPEFNEITWSGKGPLEFTVSVEVAPPVELKNYRGIRLKKTSIEVEDKEVDATLEALRERSASFEAVEKDAVESGDWVELEYKEPGGGEDGWKPAGPIEIREEDERLGAQMLGMKPEEVRAIATGPDGSGEELEVRFTEIKKKVLPPLNDELARLWGKYENLDEIKDQIKEDIRARKEIQARRALEGQVKDFLIKKNQIPLPPGLLEDTAKEYLKREQAAVNQNPSAEKEISEEKLKEKARDRAAEDLSFMFMLEEIARREEVKVDPADVAAEIRRMAGQRGADPAAFQRELESSGKIAVLEDRLRRAGALEFLIDNAKIKEGAPS